MDKDTDRKLEQLIMDMLLQKKHKATNTQKKQKHQTHAPSSSSLIKQSKQPTKIYINLNSAGNLQQEDYQQQENMISYLDSNIKQNSVESYYEQ